MKKEDSKRDMLQLEKRLVDLELAITELKDSIKSIDLSMVPDLKQKVEDVEDLIMVEQAAILELKKMLEESKPEKPIIPEDLEERLKSIESNIPNLVEKTELESKLGTAQQQPAPVEIEGLYNKLTQLETDLSAVKSQTENISNEVYEKVKEISLKAAQGKPGIDFDLLSSKIDAEKKTIDDLFNKKLELELKISEAIKKIDSLENKIRESPTQKIIDEIKLSKGDIISTNARIDSLERVSRELMNDVRNVENSAKKFETLEKVSTLSKDIEDKIDRFKFIEEETRRLSSKVETIYDSIDKRLENFRGVEKKIPELTESVSKLSNEMDKTKIEILDKTREVNKKLEKRFPELTESVSKLKEEMDKNKETVSKTIASVNINPLIKKIDSITNEYKSFAGDVSKRMISVENIRPFVEKRIDDLTKNLQPMVKKEIEPFNKRTEYLEDKVEKIKVDRLNEILTDVITKIAVIESKLGSIEKDYERKVIEMNSSIQERLVKLREPRFFDEQVKEIINKMIFLESRVIGIEKMMQERSEALPIIIE